MKKGALHLLGRKNRSLFDTNVKMTEMDNVELVLGSTAIPESGTASVRARPTVKHHMSSSMDCLQGVAVPTPKVPLLPPVNGLKMNGSVGEDSLSSGSVISVPDQDEGEILVPPHPLTAPPPPPVAFVLPPPDFMGDLNVPFPQLSESVTEEDFSTLKPPSMAPPKPPSVCSSGSASSLTISVSSNIVPEPPKFKPPEPPSQKQNKTSRAPPPKPIRLSSMTNLIDSPPETPAPPPPVQTPTLSTFNPQSPAKIYTMPKPTFLGNFEKPDHRPKQMLLLEDSGSVKPNPVLVQVNGNRSNAVSQPKPVPKDVQEQKEHVNVPNHSPSPPPEPNKELKTGTLSPSVEHSKPLPTLHQTSPQLQKPKNSGVTLESSKGELSQPLSRGQGFSPLLDRKLRNLKSAEKSTAREGHAASPLALLMAAKERDKNKSNHVMSQENSYKNDQLKASVQSSDPTVKSSAVTPRSISSPAITPQSILQDSSMYARIVKPTKTQTLPQPGSPATVKDLTLPSGPDRMAKSKSTTDLVTQLQSTLHEDAKEDLNLPVLPPPPEFDDLGVEEVEPPPSIVPPEPPTEKVPTQNISLKYPAQRVLSSPNPKPLQAPKVPPPEPPKLPHLEAPKPKLPQAPKTLPPEPVKFLKPKLSQAPEIKRAELSKPKGSEAPKLSPPQAPKIQVPQAPKLPAQLPTLKPPIQTKPKVAFAQQPTALSPSQATLLSILQKKMLEMDNKMSSVNEPESNSDDWGTQLHEENNGVPVFPSAILGKNDPAVNKTVAMKELEGKMVKKFQETSSLRSPTGNGPKSKHKYGTTFTIRPGTKQPVTLYGQDS